MKYYSAEPDGEIEEVQVKKSTWIKGDYVVTYPDGHSTTSLRPEIFNKYFFKNKKSAVIQRNSMIQERIKFHEEQIIQLKAKLK